MCGFALRRSPFFNVSLALLGVLVASKGGKATRKHRELFGAPAPQKGEPRK